MTNNPHDIEKNRRELGNRASAQQQKAADPTRSVWVNASAGTGKTKVLSDRVLRLLLAGNNPGKLLCLTYTKAAAVEMNSRVSQKLSGWAIASEEKLESELLKLYGYLPDNLQQLQKLKSTARRLFAILLDTPGGIKIQTIHSFCQEVLKRFPLEAGVSPYFEVMDDRSTYEAVEQIKNRLIEEINSHPDSEIAEAMSFLTANISELRFPDIISSIINERGKIGRLFEAYGNKEALLAAQAAHLGINQDVTAEQIITDFFDNLPRIELQTLLEAWLNSGSRFEIRAARLASVLQNPQPNDYKTYIDAFYSGDEPYKTIASKAVLDKNPNLATFFADEILRICDFINHIKSLRVFLSTKAVVCLADELVKGYNLYKKNHALMDYNDMIILTRHLLENRNTARWVLFKLDGGIDNILIDEAQDTSPDQWDIIRAVSEEFFVDENNRRTIFAVGDRKQSIYSFQGADPDKFDEMRAYFAKRAQNFSQINLEVSFRSTPAILDTVNNLFRQETIKTGVAAANEDIIHIPFRQGEGGNVEFWELIEPEVNENIDEWQPPVEQQSTPTTSSRMARQIAQKIKHMVENGEFLASQNRPLQYRDFLILVRSRDAFCEELIRECKSAGVNVAGIDRIKLLEQIAVQDLVSLGKFLLLPEDDLSLAEVLKSPLFGLGDDDLLKLCYQRQGSLWAKLEQCSVYHQTAETLKLLLNMADYVRPFELYSYILSSLNGRQHFAERMGNEAEDGLDEFLNLALTFEQSHIASLQKFIEWVVSDDVEIKREQEAGGADMVRLMTVHGSKGLQAPIVILPDTTRVPQCKREAEILWHEDKLFFYPAAAADYENVCDSLKQHQKQKMTEEYRRLMYVALTRAEDCMVVCGYRKTRKPSEDSWYSLFENHFKSISVLDEESGKRNYTSPQLLTVENKKTSAKPQTLVDKESWMTTPALVENPLARPLTPSRPEEDEPAALSPLAAGSATKLYKRGSLIHRLLQFLPNTIASKHQEMAQQFIARQAPELPQNEVDKIIIEVLALLENPNFGSVFGADSLAEVPIMGEVDGKIISGQIDRLIVEPERIIIVDFKTNRPAAATPDAIPEIYRQQMAAYRRLLEKIYPNRQIISLILWTNTANLMKVS